MTVTLHDPNAAIEPASAPLPSATAPSPAATTITDALNRRITLRKIGPLERMRLFKAIGAANSKNDQYLGYAMMAASCASLDGDPVGFPVTEGQVEAIVLRLGDEGFNAIGKAQMASMGVTEADIEAAGGDVGAAIAAAAQRAKAETIAAAKN